MKKAGRLCGVLFGGNANNGANAGLVYANTNNVPSNTSATIGSHLCYTSRIFPGRNKKNDGLATW